MLIYHKYDPGFTSRSRAFVTRVHHISRYTTSPAPTGAGLFISTGAEYSYSVFLSCFFTFTNVEAFALSSSPLINLNKSQVAGLNILSSCTTKNGKVK